MLDNILPTETPIRLKHATIITGIIKKISIQGKNMDEIEYCIIFWVGNERKEEWVFPEEIEKIPPKQEAGFKPSSNNNQTLLKS